MIATKTLAHFRTGIGNFILMTPALQALAKMDPSGQIDVCTDTDWIDSRKQALIDIWERTPFIQNVYGFNFETDAQPKMEKDYSIFFWAPWSTHAGARAYFSRRNPSPASVEWNQHKLHEVDYYFNIASRFGYKGEKPAQFVPLADDPVLEKGTFKIALCNGGFGNIAMIKRWHGFPRLADTLKKFYGDRISLVKIGYKNELSDTATDFDFVNKISFTQTAKVVSQCQLLITTDTAIMHAADALNVPMVILWGGSILAKNRPLSAPHKMIHLGYSCQPCINRSDYKDCQSLKCMDNISVNEVMYHIRGFYNGHKL